MKKILRLSLLLYLLFSLFGCNFAAKQTIPTESTENINSETDMNIQIQGNLTTEQMTALTDSFADSEDTIHVYTSQGLIKSLITSSEKRYAGDAAQIINSFMEENSILFGIENFREQFELDTLIDEKATYQIVSYVQYLKGIPVHNSNLRFAISDGIVSSVNGNYIPSRTAELKTIPELNAQQVQSILVAEGFQLDSDSKSELIIISPGITDNSGAEFLAWKTKITNEDFSGNAIVRDSDGSIYNLESDIRWFTYEVRDLQDSTLFWSQLENRGFAQIFLLLTNSRTSESIIDESTDAKVQGLISNIENTFAKYEEFFTLTEFSKRHNHIIVGINLGLVDGEVAYHSPFTFSRFGTIIYPSAFDPSTSHIFTHEFQHNVTSEYVELTHSIETAEAASIDEGISDFFSAFVDGTDKKWLIEVNGKIYRDMANPSNSNTPDHISDFVKTTAKWWGRKESINEHNNSTIFSHAMYLLSEGGTKYGVTVQPLGIERTALVLFDALALMNDNADFIQTRNAMIQACYFDAYQGELEKESCLQILNAFAAVGVGNPAVVRETPAPPQTHTQVPQGENSKLKEQSFETFLIDGVWGMPVKLLKIPYETDDWEVKKSEIPNFSDRLESKKNPGCMIIEGGMAEGGNERYFETDSKLIAGIHFRLANEYHILGKQNGQYIEWENYELRIIAGDNPEACLQDAWYILQLAAENNFGIEDSIFTETASTNVGRGVYFSYDPNLWSVTDKEEWNYLSLNGDDKCTILYYTGHGMGDDFYNDYSEKKIGQNLFEVDHWKWKSNDESVLYGYSWNNWELFMSVETLEPGGLTENCMKQVDEVMRLSEAKGFRP